MAENSVMSVAPEMLDGDTRKIFSCGTDGDEQHSLYQKPDGSCKRSKRKASQSPADVDTVVTKRSHRKSKRRSSFISGRIQQPLPQSTVSDISKQIPTEKSEADRLAELFKLGFQFTAKKLKEEFPELEDLQNFIVEGNEKVGEVVEELIGANVLSSITQNERCLPNPKNVFLDQLAEKLESQRQRLKVEEEKWTTVLENRCQAAKEAERHSKAAEEESLEIGEPPGDLEEKQQEFLRNKLDLKKIRSDASAFMRHHPYTLLFTQMASTVKMLQMYNKEMEAQQLEQIKNLYDAAFGAIETDGKKNITKFLETGETEDEIKASWNVQL